MDLDTKVLPDSAKTQQKLRALVEQFYTDNFINLTRAGISQAYLHSTMTYMIMGAERVPLWTRSELATTGQRGDAYNKLEDLFATWQGQMSTAYPAFELRPLDPDERKLASAREANGILQFHADHVWRLKAKFLSQVLPSIFTGGQCYGMLYPTKSPCDEGPQSVIGLRIIPVFNVAVAGRFENSLKEARTVCVEDIWSVEDLIRMFPSAKADILDAASRYNETKLVTREQYYAAAFGDYAPRTSNGTGEYDKEIVARLYYATRSMEFPNGHCWLTIQDKLVTDRDWPILPIEILTSAMLPVRLGVKKPPVFDAIPAQAWRNDLLNSLRAKMLIDGNPPRVKYEGVKISRSLGEFVEDDGPYKPGDTITVRPDAALIQQGVSAKEQLPQQLTPAAGAGVTMNVLQLADALMSDAIHVNADLSMDVPAGTSAEQLKTRWTIGEKKLTSPQEILQEGVVSLLKTAVKMFQSFYTEEDAFVLVEAKKQVTRRFKKESFSAGMDFKVASRIGQPTTKEAKLEVLAKVLTVFPQLRDKMPVEEALDMADLSGWGFDIGGRNCEIELAEEENRQILSGEDVYKPTLEQNHALHMLKHARLYVSEDYFYLSEEQKQKLERHTRFHIVAGKMVEKGEVGLFGAEPPRELERKLSLMTGEITPAVYDDLVKRNLSPDEALALAAKEVPNGTPTPAEAGGAPSLPPEPQQPPLQPGPGGGEPQTQIQVPLQPGAPQ